MNRRFFFKILGAVGIAPKIAQDVQAFDLPRCPRCQDSKLVTVVTHRVDDWLGAMTCYTRLDCPRCETKRYLESMQDFSAEEWVQIYKQLWPNGTAHLS